MVKMSYNKTKHYIVGWIRHYLQTHRKKAIIGISGGIDSAVCAALCCEAVGNENVIGVWISPKLGPETYIENLDQAEGIVPNDVLTVYKSLGIKLVLITLKNTIDTFQMTPKHDKLRQGNLLARLRMATLYDYAAEYNGLVIGTSNACELYTGYYTKWGDGSGDIAPIAHLLKSQVKDLARQLKLPWSIIDKIPSADLWEGQTDEGEMGVTYYDIEHVMTGDSFGNVKSEIVEKIRRMHKSTRHKTHVISVTDYDN